MKNKKYFIIGGVVLILIILLFILFGGSKGSLSDGAVAIFHDSNDINRTYIYKIDNGQANMGFEYTNAVGHGKSYKVLSSGEFDFTDGAFKVAKEHGAYSYVTVPGNDRKYSIEEFQSMFLMN